MNDSFNKIVLAYSGGLDTSVILRWLIETYQCEVIAFAADLGQEEELSGLEALAAGEAIEESTPPAEKPEASRPLTT